MAVSRAMLQGMDRLLVLGAGRFGQLAVSRLARRWPRARLIVVDQDPNQLTRFEARVEVCQQEAIAFLCGRPLAAQDWIVPAIPRHVAVDWLCFQLGRQGGERGKRFVRGELPGAVDQALPHPCRAGATLYASYADFLCPSDCSEGRVCPATGRPRPGELYATIAALELPGVAVQVVRSRQLAPGVGGFPGGELLALLDRAQQAGDQLIATACKCHGVLDALRLES